VEAREFAEEVIAKAPATIATGATRLGGDEGFVDIKVIVLRLVTGSRPD
jgi:hypothetical protein